MFDELHQAYIGIFGRHLCGALFEYLSQNAHVLQELRSRLAQVPIFSTEPLYGLQSATFEQMSGDKWETVAGIFPLLLLDLFIGDSHQVEHLRSIVPKTFAAFARVAAHLNRNSFTELQLDQLNEALDEFFPLLREYFTALGRPIPQALTVHCLNHVVPSIRECGNPGEYSTSPRAELLHKTYAKQPAHFINPQDIREMALFDNVQIADAMYDHLAFLALYRPTLIAELPWGKVAEPLFELIDSLRASAGSSQTHWVPGVVSFRALSQSAQAAKHSLPLPGNEEADEAWMTKVNEIPEHPAAEKMSRAFRQVAAAAVRADGSNRDMGGPNTVAGSQVAGAISDEREEGEKFGGHGEVRAANALKQDRAISNAVYAANRDGGGRICALSFPIRNYRHTWKKGGVSIDKLFQDFRMDLPHLPHILSTYVLVQLRYDPIFQRMYCFTSILIKLVLILLSFRTQGT